MRSPARLVTGTAAAALAAAALGLCAAAPSAYADEPVPLEITPASAAPGTTVTVNTDACGSDTAATGDASSLEASRFALAPATLKEVLAGSFRVPGNVEPGPYDIDVACENGKEASGEIEVKAAGTTGEDSAAASRTAPAPDGSDDSSPADAGDSSAYDSATYDSTGLDEAEAAGSALVPDAPTTPGRSDSSERPNPSGHESSGTHDGSASQDSSAGRDSRESSSDHETPSGHRSSAEPTAPTGHVKTGIGGSVGPDTTQIAAGAGVLAATAVGGAWLLRRRASGTQDDS
ncbi:MYXO-CTERM domain-containing protein [Streptomyces sp. 840.1]|uniref:hypothetical protein n=1 Tax=Streptomyces sp. 840.1 TaxID=2485152 RepID=UPI000FACD95B|nr:hypothetical protein [Streptomyces sp. 840.1]ROQ69066.1 MYXO-CTERM domain-containing protein [Streptomyces sp. 840.1]